MYVQEEKKKEVFKDVNCRQSWTVFNGSRHPHCISSCLSRARHPTRYQALKYHSCLQGDSTTATAAARGAPKSMPAESDTTPRRGSVRPASRCPEWALSSRGLNLRFCPDSFNFLLPGICRPIVGSGAFHWDHLKAASCSSLAQDSSLISQIQGSTFLMPKARSRKHHCIQFASYPTWTNRPSTFNSCLSWNIDRTWFNIIRK